MPLESGNASVTHAPLDVILGIMPWNFTLWQVLRFVAPTLMVGNTVLVKHAPNVTGRAPALAQLFRGAGLGEGLYTPLLIDLDDTVRVIADRRVAAVSLTGSVRAGRAWYPAPGSRSAASARAAMGENCHGTG